MKDIRIAAAVSRAEPLDVGRNFDTMARLVRDARQAGARLVCFSEMNLTGYVIAPEIRQVAEPVPGPLSQRLSALADAEEMVILAGLAEKGPADALFVSHLVAAPGREIAVYRKLHMAPPERKLFAQGEAAPVFEAAGVRFGVQLCYDAHFPEISTHMAQAGAELILVPHASPRGSADEKFRSWMRHLPARAFDNSVFLVAVNQIGASPKGLAYPGVALAMDPSGRLMASELRDEEGLLVVDLPAAALERVRTHKMRFFFPNRRPRLYERLRRNSST
ncbi:MAG: nitrilase-related carbon-nitrogen hydrolase [Desulfococcaceae bacterium]